jgi:hypothetical protein
MTTPTITSTSGNYARGVNKTVAIAPETTYGQAPAAGTVPGTLLRRNSAVFNLTTQLIASQEINPSQQTRDARQGPRAVQGVISGNLSPASYTLFWEALLRSNFVAGVVFTALTDTTATLNEDGTITVASVASNFETGGLCLGDMIDITGLTGAPETADGGENLRVIALPTSNSFTAAGVNSLETLAAWITGQTVTITVINKKLIMPATGQIVPSFTFEEWFGDVGESHVSTGCRLTQASFNIPASGFATFSSSFTGQNQVVSNTQVYTAAAPLSETTSLTAVGGGLFYKGKRIAYVNSLSLQVAAQTQADPVIGSNIAPDVVLGRLTAQGSFSCMMTEDSMLSDYLNEVELDLSMLLTDTGTVSANFFSIYLPRIKLSSGTENDTDRTITRSFNFMALENLYVPQANDTTVVIQDSQA